MRCRQNWSKECEDELNNQINREYQASLSYHVISTYFNRDDIGLQKLVDYFNKASLEEREHADKLMNYQNMRGGVVKIESIKPSKIELGLPNDILSAFTKALEMEKEINQHLLDLHKIAENDPQFCDYLEGEFLKEQVEAISELSKIISVIERFNGDQHAIWNYIETL
tara:strand:- start:7245 stop:7748 length:504 start_codon:yes stop_codon:yes gene_type:complete